MSSKMCSVTIFLLWFSLSVGHGRILVLMNRAALLSADDTISNLSDIYGKTLYHYVDGDTIDVTCLSLGENRTVKLNFGVIEKHHTGYVIASSDKSLAAGVGLRTTLRREHDHTNMSCVFSDYTSEATMNITFVLEKTFTDVMSLKINGMLIRRSNLKKGIKIRFTVYYTDVETFTFECNTTSQDVAMITRHYEQKKWHLSHGAPIKTSPSGKDIIYYEAYNKTTNITQLTVEFHFKEISGLIGNSLLNINVSGNNRFFNLYRLTGEQLIYFEYEDGDNLTLICYTQVKMIQRENYYLDFNGTEERKSQFITKKVILSSADDNTTIKCTLHYKKRIISQIRVLFHRRNTGIDYQDFIYWVPAVAAGFICIIFVAACNVRCYMKNRKRQLQAKKTGTRDNKSEVSRSDKFDALEVSATQQTAHYTVPTKGMENTTQIHSLKRKLDCTSYATTPVSTNRIKQTGSDANNGTADILKPTTSGRNNRQY